MAENQSTESELQRRKPMRNGEIVFFAFFLAIVVAAAGAVWCYQSDSQSVTEFRDLDHLKDSLEARGYVVTSGGEHGFGTHTRTALISRNPVTREDVVMPIKNLPVDDPKWKGKIWATVLGNTGASAKWGKVYVTGDPDFIKEIEGR